MKRFISALLSVVMMMMVMVSAIQPAMAASSHSPLEDYEECAHSEKLIWYWDPYYEEYSDEEHYRIEEYSYYCPDCGQIFSNTWSDEYLESHYFSYGECIECGYEVEECEHERTKDVSIDYRCKQYSENKHICIETYETICRTCDEVIDEFEEEWKEKHYFKNDKCIDCGFEKSVCTHDNTKNKCINYEAEYYNETEHFITETYETVCQSCSEVLNKYTEEYEDTHDFEDGKCVHCKFKCPHKEVEKEISYWDLDLGYYEYETKCTACKEVLDTEGYYNKEECKHQYISKIAKKNYYEKNDANTHYSYTEYDVKCTSCEESLNSITEKVAVQHTFSNNICTSCGYSKPVEPPKKEETKPSTSENTSTNVTTNIGTTTDKTPTATGNTNKTPTTSNNSNKAEKPAIESIFIDSEKSKFVVNEKAVEWQSEPIIDAKGNIQVPLRQIAEIMGWKVTWNYSNNQAIVTDGTTTKTFMQGVDVYRIETKEGSHYETLPNKVQNVNGTLYVDLDGVLDGTGFSYYCYRARSYHILPRDEVISQVAMSRVVGNYNVVGSKTILDDPQFEYEVQQNEMLFIVTENEDGTRSFTAIMPAAEQAIKGNYYDGEITWQGVVGEIIVGELPGVGTAADFRDVAADFQNWEWSWAHVGQTALDVVGCVPLIGCLKYTDEVADLLKGGKKLLNSGTEIVEQTLKKSDNFDELANVSKVAQKQADKVDEVASTTYKTAQTVSKASSKLLRENLIKAGKKVPNYPNAAHHIVAGNAKKAEGSRKILSKFGIDINDAVNGVFLPTQKGVSNGVYHPSLHTDKYYLTVEQMLKQAESKEEAIDVLKNIATKLMNGTFAH